MFDLRNQLANTGLYSENDPVSRGELKAYERQLNDLLAWHEQMKREMALDTTELLIERWEKIYNEVPKQSDTIRDRQIRLLNKRRAKGVLTPSKVIVFAQDFGYPAKVIKHIRPFCYRVEIQDVSDVKLQKLDEILTNAEPSHQTHDFGLKVALGTIDHVSYEMKAYYSDPLICGSFFAGGENDLC
ncbi:putative phage tail protein [Brevibacillus sp. FIR094]|uniref:putative phage tail protein n=1 Tax=Brevibacillus sp. FIR094 TaxID=3134809 RepID=UPI003D21C678